MHKQAWLVSIFGAGLVCAGANYGCNNSDSTAVDSGPPEMVSETSIPAETSTEAGAKKGEDASTEASPEGGEEASTEASTEEGGDGGEDAEAGTD